jgi:hypothetical protein
MVVILSDLALENDPFAGVIGQCVISDNPVIVHSIPTSPLLLVYGQASVMMPKSAESFDAINNVLRCAQHAVAAVFGPSVAR